MTAPRLQIDLDALAQNFHTLRRRVAGDLPTQRAAAVVKANAYGLGMAPIAQRLWQEGCRRFFVALADEGAQLRSMLPHAQIYVLAGVTGQTLEAIKAHGLIPVLNSLEQCRLWSQGNAGSTSALHIDTGMHRLGLSPDEAMSALPALQVELVMTHFARADEWGQAMRMQQLERFAACVPALLQRFPEALFSANNSAGALTDSVLPTWVAGLDEHRLVDRLGIGLFGANPHSLKDCAAAAVQLATVATLEAEVLQIRSVAAGASVGYGSTYTVAQACRLATIGVGYADGVSRLLSNQGQVYFRGQRFAMVGRVSMDSLVVELPADSAVGGGFTVGDWVEVFGSNIGVDEVATQMQTIAYEVFTGLGSRVRRLS
ncbi:MAG: alanine racemase [Proteobacteria bacterium]|nr:alanine racemase [Pseudomonadota bacterium]